MNTNLTCYYAQRAAEYEAIYLKPERQADLKAAEMFVQKIFNGTNVLEIACGTGYQDVAQRTYYPDSIHSITVLLDSPVAT